MTDRYVIVASLWIHEGRVQEFEAYERKAAQIMMRYGGVIERAVRIDATPASDQPFEIHVVSFPGKATFDAYRGDAELTALAADRSNAIAKTSIEVGVPGPDYSKV